MNRRSIMTWIVAFVTVPVSYKASAFIGKSPMASTLTTIEGYIEELRVSRDWTNQVLKTFVQILDDPSASDGAKLRAANVILDYVHGTSLGPYAWRRLAEITQKVATER